MDDLTQSDAPSAEDVDPASLLELLSAYVPGAETISEAEIADWLQHVARKIIEDRKKRGTYGHSIGCPAILFIDVSSSRV